MGKEKLTQEELDAITCVAKNWGKIVVRHGFGDDGPGLDIDLDQMEEIAVAAAKGVIAGTLETATSQQADRMGEKYACPTCGRACDIKTDRRTVVVRGGTFEHREPKCYCPACRRDFFPSASVVEIGHPRVLAENPSQDYDGGGGGEGI